MVTNSSFQLRVEVQMARFEFYSNRTKSERNLVYSKVIYLEFYYRAYCQIKDSQMLHSSFRELGGVFWKGHGAKCAMLLILETVSYLLEECFDYSRAWKKRRRQCIQLMIF